MVPSNETESTMPLTKDARFNFLITRFRLRALSVKMILQLINKGSTAGSQGYIQRGCRH